MERLVYNVFKTIMMAMILVFVVDMGFYIYSVLSFSAKMDTVATSMRRVVMEQNGISAEEAKIYGDIIGNIIDNYNSGEHFVCVSDSHDLSEYSNLETHAVDRHGNPLNMIESTSEVECYVNGSWTTKQMEIVHYAMGDIGDYGDISCIQLRFALHHPIWFWENGNRNADSWQRTNTCGDNVAIVDYTYFVPCLKYNAIKQPES